jgi:hypothetical protein
MFPHRYFAGRYFAPRYFPPPDATSAATASFVGDAYIYDDSGGTGSISGGTVQNADTIYDT